MCSAEGADWLDAAHSSPKQWPDKNARTCLCPSGARLLGSGKAADRRQGDPGSAPNDGSVSGYHKEPSRSRRPGSALPRSAQHTAVRTEYLFNIVSRGLTLMPRVAWFDGLQCRGYESACRQRLHIGGRITPGYRAGPRGGAASDLAAAARMRSCSRLGPSRTAGPRGTARPAR
jgi:hypothetical protein